MTKIEREKRTIELMIKIYCKKKHKNKELCDECQELLEYAHKRLSFCKFVKKKLLVENVLYIVTKRI